jgi:mitogen-activated protein kinase kinase
MSAPSDTPPGAPEDSRDFAPSLPSSAGSSESTLREDAHAQAPENLNTLRLAQLRSVSDTVTTSMTPSSTPLGLLNNARRPAAAAPSLSSMRAGGGLPQDMQAKMMAFHLSRQGTPPGGRPSIQTSASTGTPESPTALSMGGLPGGLRLPPNVRPQAQGFSSAPAVPRSGAKPSLSERRKMKLPGGLPGSTPSTTDGTPNGSNGVTSPIQGNSGGSMFNKFSEFVDTKNGTLKFAGKAVIHGQGIDFSSGSNFSISLDEVDTLEELGKGNYGTVYKVRHSRPRIRRPGMGLAGNKASASASPVTTLDKDHDSAESSPIARPNGGTSGIIMAMKEIRLELDEAKFAAIIMELDILHRCISPYIIDFYGAFFQEGAVYICIEFMDGGSIDNLYGDGIPENVLRKITYATTKGLKELKDVHNIIHRDVKPTNILVNSRGQVKICDFGVSGNLVASIAKTNIGCQSYMAPERISGGGIAQAGANPGGGTYSVQSDIWSLGLTIIECALGRYPYPPETYNNIFSQLSVSQILVTEAVSLI